MEDVRTGISRLWAGDIARGTDAIIGKAILLATGERWQVLDMSRVLSRRFNGEKYQTILLDGEPILELHDLTFDSGQSDAVSYILSASQNYRFLGKAAANALTPDNSPEE